MKKHQLLASLLYLSLISTTFILSDCKGDRTDQNAYDGKDTTHAHGFGASDDEGEHRTSLGDTALRSNSADTLGSTKGKTDKDTSGAAESK